MFGCNNYHVLILISWGGGEGGNMKQYATYNVVISNYCVHECDCRFYRISDMHGTPTFCLHALMYRGIVHNSRTHPGIWSLWGT